MQTIFFISKEKLNLNYSVNKYCKLAKANLAKFAKSINRQHNRKFNVPKYVKNIKNTLIECPTMLGFPSLTQRFAIVFVNKA